MNFRTSATNLVPAAARNILYAIGTWLEPAGWSDWSCPEADIRVLYSDLLRRMATDPGYGEIGGVGAGFFRCTDDDVLRWLCKAVRHYAIEGRTNDLAAAYGMKYLPGHVTNPDFARQFEGWRAEPGEPGSLGPHVAKGFGTRSPKGWSGEGRQHVKAGVGDSVALFTRSAKAPNRLSQRVTGLVPGRVYCLEFVTCDQAEWEKPWSVPEAFAVRATVTDGADEIPELAYCHNAPKDESRREHKSRGILIAQKKLHRVIFRATKPSALLTFSDWAADAAPDAPVGRKTMLNWVNLRQYYLESDEELEWLKQVSRRQEGRRK